MLTGLEAERSVLEISYSQERRSLGWRWKDPSREFLIPRRGGHWSGGGGKIRLENFLFPGEAVAGLEVERSVSRISYSQERHPSWEFLIPRRGGHWSGGGKIRLGN